jgi:hypothetical protein
MNERVKSPAFMRERTNVLYSENRSAGPERPRSDRWPRCLHGKSESGGIGLGIATGVLAGAAVAGAYSQPVYADGYLRCGRIRQYDAYGNYIGRVRTCA